ncbi:MAG: sulfur carrier protein ThiS [Proteobacteria bacterium]|nr:sulfur carrier protein ThiS [Pseudomonadota bacterium]
MQIIVNNEQRTIDEGRTIAQMLDMLRVPRAGTAVAINGSIVPRDEHERCAVCDGDRIDILRPIGGG